MNEFRTRVRGVSRRTKLIAGQGVITAIVVVALLCTPLNKAFPVGATGSSTQPQAVSGVDGAISSVVPPAPSGYRDQLQNYLSSMLRSAQQNTSQPGSSTLVVLCKTAQQLVSSASPQDLSLMYYQTSQLPSFQSVLKKYQQGAGYYHASMRYLKAAIARDKEQAAFDRNAGKLSDKGRIRPLDFASSTDCPAPGDTPAVIISLTLAWIIAYGIFQLFAASFFIEALGEGTTIPVSPIRTIAAVLSIPLELAKDGASAAAEIRLDCIEQKHRDQVTDLDNYVHNLTAVQQMDIHVTPVDAYHFLISTHEYGEPFNINTSSLVVQSMQGAATTGQIVTNLIAPTNPGNGMLAGVSFQTVANADGLYYLTVPAALAGTSYRIDVDDGGLGGCSFIVQGSGDPCTHYGSTVFTKLTNS